MPERRAGGLRSRSLPPRLLALLALPHPPIGGLLGFLRLCLGARHRSSPLSVRPHWLLVYYIIESACDESATAMTLFPLPRPHRCRHYAPKAPAVQADTLFFASVFLGIFLFCLEFFVSLMIFSTVSARLASANALLQADIHEHKTLNC